MIQALLLIFEGASAWDRLVLKEQGLAKVFFIRLLPMMIITAVFEGLGMAHWGKWQPILHSYRHFSHAEIIAYQVGQSLMNLVMILVSTWLIRELGRTFHGRMTYTFTRTFTAVVYGFGPMYLFRLLDALPAMNPYVTWMLGITLSIAILYNGLPRLLIPDPTHAFGLYMSSSIVLLLASGMVRVLTALYFQGRVDISHSFIVHSIQDLMQ